MRYIKQRLSYKEKIANDYEWAKEVIDSFEIQADSYMGQRDRLKMMERCYGLYNNQVDQEDIEQVFNPLGVDVGQKRDKINAFNKAHNKINTLIGEMLKRPSTYKNVIISPERAIAVEEIKDKLIKEFLISQINKKAEIDMLVQQGLAEEELQQALQELEQKYAEVKSPDQIAEYLKDEYLEPREIKANDILEDITIRQRIAETKADSFKHALLAGEEIVWVGERNGNTVIEPINPLFAFYHKSPETKYIQDGDYAGVKYKASLGEVFDNYTLDKKDLDYLEEKYAGDHSSMAPSRSMKYHFDTTDAQLRRQLIAGSTANRHRGSYGYAYEDMIDVMHVEWKSQKKIGLLTVLNEDGEADTVIVDEEFKFDKNNPLMLDIEWMWVEEVWEGTKIDDIYVDIRPITYQEDSVHSLGNKKLRYHGIIYDNMNATAISMMERMRPFQYLYIIIMHNLKKLISQDRGKLVPFDTSQIDNEFGTEKTLYYMQELSLYPFNSQANAEEANLAHRGGPQNSIDRSNSQHIMNYIGLLEYVDAQIGEVAGISKPREGQVGQYETATNAQQSIIQSSNITELLFFTHAKLWERILECAVNLETRLKGPGYHTLTSAGSNPKNMVIREQEFDNADFQVFLTDSPEDNEIFRQIKSLYQPLLQHDKARFSQIIKMLRQKTSMEELIRDIESFEQLSDQMAQQQVQARQQEVQAQIEANQQLELLRMQHEKDLKQMDVDKAIRVAEIGSFARQMDQDVNDNNVPDQLEIERLKADIIKNERDAALQSRKLDLEEKQSERDAKLKKEEIRVKEIAARKKPSGGSK